MTVLAWTVAVLLTSQSLEQPTARIAGLVRDATGAPLADVTIVIRGAVEQAWLTEADGGFEFQDLPPGAYQLTATREQFTPQHRVVRLIPGARETLSLTLSVEFVEHTIVTGTKSGESDLQATPMSISALPATDLGRVQAHTIEGLAGLAPSVTFSTNAGYAQLTIRGIGSNVVFAGSDPSSAVYIDGVYIARPAMLFADFLDLERVEVLRGPQGTLYGRNAVGGALNLISRSPATDFESSVDISIGGYDMFRAKARASGPIVAGKIFGSGSVLRGVRRGFVEDLDHPDHPLGGEDVLAARGQLRVQFNRRTDLLVSGDVTHQDPPPLTYAKVLAVKPGFEVDNPAVLHEVRTSTLAESRNTQHGVSARLSMSLTPRTTLTSLSAFRNLDYDAFLDADITELPLLTSHPHEAQSQVSEELTIAHRRPGLTWLAGLFLFDETDRQPIVVGFEAARQEMLLDPRVDAGATAVFGQATIAVAPRLAVTGGLRYSDERKSIDNAGARSTIDPPTTVLPSSAYSYTDDIDYSAWTPKAGVEWQARQDALVYLSATRGFKSGGFNLSSTEPGRGYAPEWAWSYEGGLKTGLANGRARLNVAAFEMDYTNLQVQTPIRPGVLDISNAAAATIRGVEMESSVTVTPGAQAGGHLAWLDARYDRYVAVGIGGVTGDVAGNRLNNAPEWSGRLWLQWNHDLEPGQVSVRADSRWQSTVFFTPFNDHIQRQTSYGLVDFSAEFRPRNARWSIAAFARNLTNQDYITGTFSTPPPAIGGRPGERRQIGIQLKFDTTGGR